MHFNCVKGKCMAMAQTDVDPDKLLLVMTNIDKACQTVCPRFSLVWKELEEGKRGKCYSYLNID